MTSSAVPSLHPSSETSLPKKSTLAVQEIASAISYLESSLTGSYMRQSSAKASSQAEKASKLVDKNTEALSLVSGSTESANEAKISALKTRTLITSPPTHRGLISDTKSSKNVESTRRLFMTSRTSSTGRSSSREVAVPQKPTVVISPSPVATSTLTMRDRDQESTITSSMLGMSEDTFATTKANFRSNHTKILDHATNSVKLTQTVTGISGASVVEVKESDTDAPAIGQLKNSRSSLFSAESIKMKVSTMSSYTTENVKLSVSGETKASRTTDRKHIVTPGETMVEWLPSTTVHQSSILAVRGTEPVLKTTSLAGPLSVISHHNDYVTSTSQSSIIQPSETSEESEDTPHATSVIVTQKPPANTTDVLFIEGAPEGKENPDVLLITGTNVFSPNVIESGFWNPGHFCSWIPESCNFSCGIRNPGLRNPGHSSRNPVRIPLTIEIRNPCSTDKEYWMPESTSCNPESKSECLGIPYMGWFFFFRINSSNSWKRLQAVNCCHLKLRL